MKLRHCLLTGAAASALFVPALAQAGDYYLSVFGGFSSPDEERVNVGPFSSTDTTYQSTDIPLPIGSLFFLGLNGNNYVVQDGGVTSITQRTSRYFTRVDAVSEDALDNGFVVGLALGARFDQNWRAELEAAYRKYDSSGRHSVDAHIGYTTQGQFTWSLTGTIYAFYGTNAKQPFANYADFTGVYTALNPFVVTATVAGGTSTTVSAKVSTDSELSSYSLMANLWYDFDLGDSPITPFIGGGIGVARLDLEYRAKATMPSTYFSFTTWGPFSSTVRGSDDGWVFAWQFGAGLGYDLGDGMMLAAQYRYFSAGDLDVAGQDVGVHAHEGLVSLNIPLGN